VLPFTRSRFLCAPEDPPTTAGTGDPPPVPAASLPDPAGVATKTDLQDLDASWREEFRKLAGVQEAREAAERVRAATASDQAKTPEKKSSPAAAIAGGVALVVGIVVVALFAAAKRARS
jgi:hypothetical protein